MNVKTSQYGTSTRAAHSVRNGIEKFDIKKQQSNFIFREIFISRKMFSFDIYGVVE